MKSKAKNIESGVSHSKVKAPNKKGAFIDVQKRTIATGRGKASCASCGKK